MEYSEGNDRVHYSSNHQESTEHIGLPLRLYSQVKLIVLPYDYNLSSQTSGQGSPMQSIPLDTPPVVVRPILPDAWNKSVTDSVGILVIAGEFGLQGAIF